MKKILHLGLVCASIAIIATATSCSKAYNSAPYPGQDTTKNLLRGDFTAVVDGEAFVANSKAAYDNTDNGVRTISISGVMDSKTKDPKNNKSIVISITNYNGPGVYPIQMGTAGTYISLVEGVPAAYLAKAGDTTALISITNDQGTIDGTFSFVVAPNGLGTADNHNISNGAFSVPK